MTLPDTSVWVEYLRAAPAAGPASERDRPGDAEISAADALDELIERDAVLTCGPVVAELLAGARGRGREELAEQMRAQPWVELSRSDWLTVGHTAARLREKGHTTPLLDVQIAVCAVTADAELWTRYGDFERIAQSLDGLRVRRFR